MTSSSPELSVVVPFYNEESCAGALLDEILAVLRLRGQDFEIVAVDDASTDETSTILSTYAQRHTEVRVLQFGHNRGQAAALFDGLWMARGSVLATMDGDGQNDPADLPAMLDALPDWDMVVGIRQNRHDSRVRRWMSRLANAVRSRVLRDGMTDSGCALKVFRSEVCSSLIPMRTLYSFIPALAIAGGFRVTQMPVHHRSRQGGTSSYGLRQFLWRPLLDLIGVRWFISRRLPPATATRSQRQSAAETAATQVLKPR
ncbi:MAG: glycosyltransferase family 2 protein [Thermoanaerobaculia bacterium]|nr:glycosyltransferase family 2 protein [Thermoanaerobaculia bacterium]